MSSHSIFRVGDWWAEWTPECCAGGLLVSLAFVGVETGLEIESLLANITFKRLVLLLLTVLVWLPHVSCEVQDGGQHQPTKLTLKVNWSFWLRCIDGIARSLGLGILWSFWTHFSFDAFREINKFNIVFIFKLIFNLLRSCLGSRLDFQRYWKYKIFYA